MGSNISKSRERGRPHQIRMYYWSRFDAVQLEEKIDSGKMTANEREVYTQFGYAIVTDPPLSVFVLFENYECVDVLVRKGADVDARGFRTGETALHLAAFTGNHEMVKKLLEAGASKNVKSKTGALARDVVPFWDVELRNMLEPDETNV